MICKKYNGRIFFKFENQSYNFNCSEYKSKIIFDYSGKEKIYDTLKAHSRDNCRINNNNMVCVSNGILYMKNSNEEYYQFDIENKILDDFFNIIFPSNKYSNIYTEAKIFNLYENLFYLNDFNYNWSLCKRKITLRKL